MKRAEFTGATLAVLIILAVSLIILIGFLVQYKQSFADISSKAGCSYSLILSDLAQTTSFGLGDIPPECKADRLTVDKKALTNVIKKNKVDKVLKEYGASNNPLEIKLSKVYSVDDSNSKYRWAFSKIVADAMNDCRVKTWADANLREGKGFAGELRGVQCIVCSTIRIDPSVFNTVSYHDSLVSFDDWLKINKPKLAKKSYYDLLVDSFDFSALGAQAEEFKDYYLHGWRLKNSVSPDDAVAVMYVHYPREGADIRFISLYPYSGITSKPAIDVQAFKIFGRVADRPKCGVIID